MSADPPQRRPPFPAREGGQGGRSVGIFVNQSPDEVAAIVRECDLDFLQLSGDEDAAYCRLIASRTGRPVIKAIRLGRGDRAPRPEEFYGDGSVCALLADATVAGSWGGSGQTWDWGAAAGLASRVPLLLAGGLTAQNVAAAIGQVRPWGVDVASGVETDGQTDPDRVREFVELVKTPHPLAPSLTRGEGEIHSPSPLVGEGARG